MISPKPSADSTRAAEPKRERGRQRVAAIMDAGVEVFTEKGYDAATMTEIAARSGTAIGSLYRFFPSKEALADALLLRYAQHVRHGLAELAQQVPDMTLDSVADAFVDFMLVLQAQRSFAVALVDARGGSAALRVQFREAVRGGVADILRKAIAGLSASRSKAMATVLLPMIKSVINSATEEPAMRAVLLAEVRELVRLYFASAAAGKKVK
ncbi:TetR/AcrR family transcriptional regulator [Paraburkholderia sp. D15]|uniref:TetR/AcrR family transcriptional regulator n=1 Tax=Paraburkholderia sp. D15 TaxID=2880218 RepID=UPI00247B04C4|nr:TetR/AcrR family transcriptional regulator [Paraburkholderia sp. D15]WGS54087.1 TetR/AcrR family transcriptional regulator [Paraburkholderia sp. D15]